MEYKIPDVYIMRRNYGRQWAVHKKDNKRAVRVFDNYEDALKLALMLKKPFLAEHRHIKTFVIRKIGGLGLFREKITWKVIKEEP